MQATRRLRLQAVIQEELSMVIPQAVKDPRVPNITITSVEVTPDASQATVYIAILGAIMTKASTSEVPAVPQIIKPDEKKAMRDCIAGLTSAAGYLRRHLAKILTVRHIPTLIFKEDRGFENTIRVQELLKEISSAPKASSGDPESEPKS